MPYTIVLAPPQHQAMQYIEASQSLYSPYEPSYLLNDQGTSSPHITLIQFDCDSEQFAEKIWTDVCIELKAQKFTPFSPIFIGISFIEGQGVYQGSTWIELAVKRGEETSPLMKAHQIGVNVLKHHDIKPLNANGSDYRPHLTLARIVMPKRLEMITPKIFHNEGNFRLEFGKSDEEWQYVKTLDCYDAEK